MPGRSASTTRCASSTRCSRTACPRSRTSSTIRAGLAIITEGLLGYIAPDDLTALWRRFAAALAGFTTGRYISDLHLASAQTIEVRVFRVVLAAFVRGQVYLHFDDAAEAEAALREAGFESATVRPANEIIGEKRQRGAQLAHILEASTV